MSELSQSLLQPSLTETHAPTALFSARAQFLTSFFGGPLAAVWLSFVNAGSLGRAKKDLPRYLVALGFALGMLTVVGLAASGQGPMTLLLDPASEHFRSLTKYINQGFGLLLCGALYLPYSKYHKAMELTGTPPRKPWVACLITIVVCQCLQIGLITVITLKMKGVI